MQHFDASLVTVSTWLVYMFCDAAVNILGKKRLIDIITD